MIHCFLNIHYFCNREEELLKTITNDFISKLCFPTFRFLMLSGGSKGNIWKISVKSGKQLEIIPRVVIKTLEQYTTRLTYLNLRIKSSVKQLTSVLMYICYFNAFFVNLFLELNDLQNQSLVGVLWKSCSESFLVKISLNCN